MIPQEKKEQLVIEEVIKHFRINFDECKDLPLNEGIYDDLIGFIESATANTFHQGYRTGVDKSITHLQEMDL